jgi:DNA replication and repair protein RecF
MSELYETLSSGENLSSRYLPSWEVAEDRDITEADLVSELESSSIARRTEELSRGTTLFGPHRDDVLFEIDGRGARAFSSQGQQRTITLAWKLAEVSVVKDITGQEPLLLLDDVMSELDQNRRNSLALFVGEAAQTVITTTNLGYFDAALMDRALVVTLP